MKLTLVNVLWQGRRYSAFVNLPVGEDGKVRIKDWLIYLKLCDPALKIDRGHCIGYGV